MRSWKFALVRSLINRSGRKRILFASVKFCCCSRGLSDDWKSTSPELFRINTEVINGHVTMKELRETKVQMLGSSLRQSLASSGFGNTNDGKRKIKDPFNEIGAECLHGLS